jgi:hypothetical protein
VVDLGTHTVTYIRIALPALPALPVSSLAPASVAAPTAEESTAEAARAAKVHAELSPSCTVYPGTPTITELVWWHEGRRLRAWSNINFLHLASLSVLETTTHVFWWQPFVSEASLEGVPSAERPAGLSLFTAADATPVYYFEGDEAEAVRAADEAATFLGLDHLHAYYELHRENLAADYARRAAEAAEREAALARNPPRPANTTVYFWRKPAP